jgi:membrane-bound lytic murein transglycosylase D
MIHRILEEEGLPADLIYVAFLESTYKPNAYSRARAKGIWQFMTPTGRMYGLKIDKYVDERSHPEKATRAAARYLKDLYAIFNDWTLAIAAYNTGAGNILRAQRRTGKTDYWDLARTKHMHRDTKGFVPCITALGLMSKNPEAYGFEGLQRNAPVTWDTVVVDNPTSIGTLAKLAGVSDEEIRFLNPHLRRGVTPPGRKEYEVMVPPGTGERFRAAYGSMPPSERIASVTQTHVVRRGETLASIAVRYGTTPQELASANQIRNVHRISVGMQLEVPAQVGNGGSRQASAYTDGDYEPARRSTHHTVRRGDTLSSIARSFGVSLNNLMSWNGLSQNSIIKPGMRLAVRSSAAHRTAPLKPQPLPQSPAGLVSIPGGGQAPPDQAGARTTYVVRRGDNLFRLSKKFRTTVEQLKAWNNIPGESIQAGQTLVIYPN